MKAEDLIAFEKSIAEEFDAGRIRAPIHLSGGNERRLLRIAKNFIPGDYFFSQWRSHYHALLAGVPPEKVRAQIMAGRSMTLCWPEHRFFSSAIVGGCCPIALGVAAQIKRSGGEERVWCFMGEMTAETGIAHECMKYAFNMNLPVIWVIEDNSKSVCTDTRNVWGNGRLSFSNMDRGKRNVHNIFYYRYNLKWPHSGSGKRIEF